MKLLEFLEITEAKFKKPEVMYHGTSSKHLQSILSNGVIPNPKDKTWGDVEREGLDTFTLSLASLQGSYWTNNLLTAKSSAFKASPPRSEYNQLFVVAQIAKQSAFSDEDSYISVIFRAMSDTFTKISGIRSPLTGEATMKSIALSYFTDLYKPNGVTDKETWVKVFGENLHQSIAENPEKQPIDWNLMKALFETILLRTLIHEKKHATKWMKDKWVEAIERVMGEITITPSEIEHKLHDLREKLTRTYRGAARSDDFMNTLRITEPVNYRGANRILMVLEYRLDEEDDKRRLYGHYVHRVPEEFISDWMKSIGRFPGIVNPRTGEFIMEPIER